ATATASEATMAAPAARATSNGPRPGRRARHAPNTTTATGSPTAICTRTLLANGAVGAWRAASAARTYALAAVRSTYVTSAGSPPDHRRWSSSLASSSPQRDHLGRPQEQIGARHGPPRRVAVGLHRPGEAFLGGP